MTFDTLSTTLKILVIPDRRRVGIVRITRIPDKETLEEYFAQG